MAKQRIYNRSQLNLTFEGILELLKENIKSEEEHRKLEILQYAQKYRLPIKIKARAIVSEGIPTVFSQLPAKNLFNTEKFLIDLILQKDDYETDVVPIQDFFAGEVEFKNEIL